MVSRRAGTSRLNLKLKDSHPDPCNSCPHAVRVLPTFDWIQCQHPKVIEIEQCYPERNLKKHSLIVAKALNKMAKALNLRVNPNAFKRNFFRWPWSYFPREIEDCSTKVAVHELAHIARGYTRGPRDPVYQVTEGSIEELKKLVGHKDDSGIIEWFKRYFPGSMEFVPSKKLTFEIYSRVLLEGFWKAVGDGRIEGF